MKRKYCNWGAIAVLCAASFGLGNLMRIERADAENVGEVYRFGDCVYALGQKEAEVLESFRREFIVNMGQPDPDRPENSFYGINQREGEKKYIGSLCFEHGVLTSVNRILGDVKSPECGMIVSRLVSALAEMAERSKAPVGVRWDNGVFQGRKIGNTTIQLYSGNEGVEMTYFDSPGGAQTVTLTSSISEKSSVQD